MTGSNQAYVYYISYATLVHVSIANTMCFYPCLDVRLHYQSPTMPRRYVAAFCYYKNGVGYGSSKTGSKRQRSTEFGWTFIYFTTIVWLQKVFIIVKQMGKLEPNMLKILSIIIFSSSQKKATHYILISRPIFPMLFFFLLLFMYVLTHHHFQVYLHHLIHL